MTTTSDPAAPWAAPTAALPQIKANEELPNGEEQGRNSRSDTDFFQAIFVSGMYLKISANNTAMPADETITLLALGTNSGMVKARQNNRRRQPMQPDHQRDEEEKSNRQDHAERKEALFDCPQTPPSLLRFMSHILLPPKCTNGSLAPLVVW
jgi:hypothetical protein